MPNKLVKKHNQLTAFFLLLLLVELPEILSLVSSKDGMTSGDRFPDVLDFTEFVCGSSSNFLNLHQAKCMKIRQIPKLTMYDPIKRKNGNKGRSIIYHFSGVPNQVPRYIK